MPNSVRNRQLSVSTTLHYLPNVGFEEEAAVHGTQGRGISFS